MIDKLISRARKISLLSKRSVAAPMLLILICTLSACAKPTVDVNLHGVNYSAETFSYSVTDPTDPQRSSGGEMVDPYAAGGTTCCAPLPKKWHSGIKLQVDTTHWLKKKADGTLPEIRETHLVEIPPYVDGQPGDLWVLRNADGKIGVVSSIYQPDHPKWPGKMKGWPVPSLEYRRERWEIIMHEREIDVQTAKSLLDDLEKNPKVRTQQAWDHDEQYNRDDIKDFSGSQDPRYIAHLKNKYEKFLLDSKSDMEKVLKEKP